MEVRLPLLFVAAASAMVPAEDQRLLPAAPVAWTELLVGDLDGDGFADLLARGENPMGVRWVSSRGGPSGLDPVLSATTLTGRGAVRFDFDADGDTDVALYDDASGRVEVFAGGPNFPRPVTAIPTADPDTRLTVADADGDGLDDLVVQAANADGTYFGVVGGLTLPTPLPGRGWPSVADGDGDGVDDLFLADGNQVRRHPGGAGGFAPVADVTFTHPRSQRQLEPERTGADLNGDGFGELVVFDPDRGLYDVLYGRANGLVFGKPLPGGGAPLALCFVPDADGDGDDEAFAGAPTLGPGGAGLVVAALGGVPPTLTLATGSSPGIGAGAAVAAGDLNGDGWVDRVTTEGEALVVFFGP